MCGIAGVIAPRGDAMPFARAMHRAIAHRGPDDQHIDHDGAILCHRRLSIIDLSTDAAQPMVSGPARITYNGEIYNYRELREECVRRGASFRTSSDTEVILALYLLDGEAAFGRLDGMFAFCITDERDGSAWLVRDRFGIKPLYFAETPHGIAFASELGAILDSGIVPFAVDLESLQAYVQLDFVPSPRTIVRGVQKLPGGELVHITRAGRATRRPYAWKTGHPAGQSESSTDFDRVIRNAVTKQLVADVPVGVFLSGGIDSSIVAKVANDAAGRIATFSIAFDDPSFDESHAFELAARVIGSDHHSERLTAKAMLDLLPIVARTVSEPLADGSIFPTMLLARFTRQHVKVALSGDGADELFAGYPTHRLIRAGRLAALLPRRLMSKAAHALLPVSHANLSLDYRIKKFFDGADRDAIVQNEKWLGSFDGVELLRTFDAAAQERLLEALHEPSRGIGNPLEAVLHTDRRFYLQDQVLVKVDRASMASALEVRVPMLDPDVVRFADSLPNDRKLPSKRILREWASAHFPPELWKRPKKGFGAPLARWFRGELRELVHDTLAIDDGFFRPDAVRRMLDDHDRGRRDERKRIFNVLMFTLWYRAFRR